VESRWQGGMAAWIACVMSMSRCAQFLNSWEIVRIDEQLPSSARYSSLFQYIGTY